MKAPQSENDGQDSKQQEFLWGVSTSAYQSEGGYNGENQPQTNWAKAEREKDVAPLGDAADFWQRYPQDFALCRAMGLTAFRLSLEWSRIQPSLSNETENPPCFDRSALDHYADMLIECRKNGLEPIVTLHHFVHPAWLGDDPWLEPTTINHFTRYVIDSVRHVNNQLVSKGYSPIRYYITINEPNMLIFNTYLGNQFPSSATGGVKSAIKACCQLLSAHISAYNSIHDLYEAQAWETPMVSLNNYCSDLYWADKLLLDLLTLRENKISLNSANIHIKNKRAEFNKSLKSENIPLKKNLFCWFGTFCKNVIDKMCSHNFDIAGFESFTHYLLNSPREKLLDYIALDYYDPFSAHVFRPPSFYDHEFKNKSITSYLMNSISSKWWDWHVLPQGLHFFCRYYSHEFMGKSILIAENGMALRRKMDNQTSHRRDRVTRSQFINLHFQQILKMLNENIPLIGYLHWSLFDNYEWGTYTPRFGIYSIDYKKGYDRIAEDHHGDFPSTTYETLIKQFKAETS